MGAASLSQQILSTDPEALRALLRQNLVSKLLECLANGAEEVDVHAEVMGAVRNLVSVAPADIVAELMNRDAVNLIVALFPKVCPQSMETFN